MPELPELQALSERLSQALAGAPFERVTVIGFSGLKTVQPPPDALVGRTLDKVWRRGKYLVFESGELRTLVHLSQGGRIDLEDPPKSSRPKGGVVRLRFAKRPSLLVKEFGTERKVGWWVLAANDPGPLEGLGPDPFDDGFEQLIAKGADRRRLHSFLRDQRTVAGIGRGFADDILHEAELSPFASLSSLDDSARARLVTSVRAVLEEALARERKRTGGLPAKMTGRFTVHHGHGRPCPRCGDTLRRVSFESHEITYCPRCQTGGKLLADRRLSRLLK